MAADDSGSRPDLQIQVHAPLTWWRARPDQISNRLQDPDRGNIPRWPSYDQDWKAIGATVSTVADAIAAGKYSVDPQHGDIGVVRVPDTGLGVTETKIVHAWFRSSGSVTSDPWIDEWSDGRHRTWYTAQENPGLALPIQGGSIRFANSYDIPHLGANWEKMFQEDLRRLNSLKWFDRSDPLNAQFVQSLEIAAAGKVPPLVMDAMQRQQVMGAAAEGGTAAAIARAVAKHRALQPASDQSSATTPGVGSGAGMKETKGSENQQSSAVARAAEPGSKWGRMQAEAIQRRKASAAEKQARKAGASKTDAARAARRADQIRRDGGRSI